MRQRQGQALRRHHLTVQTWAAAIEGYERRIALLPAPQTPDAGDRRIAAFVALLPNVTSKIEKIEDDVRLVKPTLFGIFLEAAALAFAFYGFRPGNCCSCQHDQGAGRGGGRTVARRGPIAG